MNVTSIEDMKKEDASGPLARLSRVSLFFSIVFVVACGGSQRGADYAQPTAGDSETIEVSAVEESEDESMEESRRYRSASESDSRRTESATMRDREPQPPSVPQSTPADVRFDGVDDEAGDVGGGARPQHFVDPAVSGYTTLVARTAELDQVLQMNSGTGICSDAFALRDEICALSDRVCAIANRNPEDDATQERCEDGRGRCTRATERVAERCP